MRGVRATLAGVCLMLVAGAPMEAQVCAGGTPLITNELRVVATGSVHRYARATAVAIEGGSRYYGGIGYGTTYDPETDINTDDFYLRLMTDWRSSSSRWFLCPGLSLVSSTGQLQRPRLLSETRMQNEALSVGVAHVGLGASARFVEGGSVALSNVAVHVPLVGNDQGLYALTSAFVGATIRSATIKLAVNVPSGLPSAGGNHGYLIPFGWEDRELSTTLSVSLRVLRFQR